MTTSTLIFISLALVPLYVAYQRFLCPLAGIPGPLSASLSKWWLVKHTRSGDIHREMIRLHAMYGPMVRIAPNFISIADPAAFKKIYGSSFCCAR